MVLTNKRVLITGATGFIGANLLRYLVEHYDAFYYAMIRKNSNLWRIDDIKESINLIKLDLNDKKRLDKTIIKIDPEIIFHLSAFGGFSFQKDIDKIIETNLSGTFNLLQSVSNLTRVPAFINTGSSSEYGVKQKIMEERDFLEPVTYYGFAKASLTLLSQVFYYQRKIPVVTLRLFSPYGYFDSQERLIPYIILSLLKNRDVIINSPDSVRDYVFIDDVISAYIKALKFKNKRGQVYNIGSGRQISIKKITDIIKKHLDSRSRIIIKDNNRIPENESKKWQASIIKAKKDLNWRPETDLENGIKKTIKWFKDNINKFRQVR
jgi:nucleoside-diphosphate-sugar epimerase